MQDIPRADGILVPDREKVYTNFTLKNERPTLSFFSVLRLTERQWIVLHSEDSVFHEIHNQPNMRPTYRSTNQATYQTDAKLSTNQPTKQPSNRATLKL